MSERHWLLWFDDTERQCEVFTDEAAARQRHKDCLLSWSCTLFSEDCTDGNHVAILASEQDLDDLIQVLAARIDAIKPSIYTQRLNELYDGLCQLRKGVFRK